MATQLRDYRIRAGELDRFVDEWRTNVASIRQSLGFRIPAAWTAPEEDRFIWLLEREGDWDDFKEADEAYYASPARTSLDPDPARLIVEQHTVRLSEVNVP